MEKKSVFFLILQEIAAILMILFSPVYYKVVLPTNLNWW